MNDQDRPRDAFATRAVHAGLTPDPSFGSVIPAIHQTSTYAQRRPGEFVEDYDYARSANPTRTALEHALGELEGGYAVTFSSGLAAEHAVITTVCGAGSHMVLPADLYGGTFRLVDKVMNGWGLQYDLVDQTDVAALEQRDPARARSWSGSRVRPTRRLTSSTSKRSSRGAAKRSWWSTTPSQRRSTNGRWNTAQTSSCIRRRSTWVATRTSSAAPRSRAAASSTSGCGSFRTRPVRFPARSTASSSIADCARSTSGWRLTRAAQPQSSNC